MTDPDQLPALPRKLLDVACRMRVGETLFRDDELVDQAAHELKAERARADALQAENAKLKTTMVAAAEEIATHWDAHCDAEGYGPQNLMRRLEEGIPAEYGYTAGAFAELTERADALEAALLEVLDANEEEAKTQLTLENAQANYSKWGAEHRAATQAMIRASQAEKAARALLKPKGAA